MACRPAPSNCRRDPGISESRPNPLPATPIHTATPADLSPAAPEHRPNVPRPQIPQRQTACATQLRSEQASPPPEIPAARKPQSLQKRMSAKPPAAEAVETEAERASQAFLERVPRYHAATEVSRGHPLAQDYCGLPKFEIPVPLAGASGFGASWFWWKTCFATSGQNSTNSDPIAPSAVTVSARSTVKLNPRSVDG